MCGVLSGDGLRRLPAHEASRACRRRGFANATRIAEVNRYSGAGLHGGSAVETRRPCGRYRRYNLEDFLPNGTASVPTLRSAAKGRPLARPSEYSPHAPNGILPMGSGTSEGSPAQRDPVFGYVLPSSGQKPRSFPSALDAGTCFFPIRRRWALLCYTLEVLCRLPPMMK